jgi:CRISPR-associated endonuclease Csn1
VKVSFKNKPTIEGYYAGMNRSTGAINILTHDRNKRVGKDGVIESIGIKTSLSVEKFNVDVLGQIYRVHSETRQPLRSR